MKKLSIYAILAFLLFTAHISYSQELWSLNRCIDYALENNIQIKQQEIVAEQGENKLLQSKMNLLPSVSASAGHNFNWGKSVNVQDLKISNTLTQSTSASISASLTLMEGLSNINAIKSSRHDLMIAKEGIESLKNDISIQITKAYLEVLLALEIEKIAKDNLQSVAAQVSRTKKLVEAGDQAYSVLADIESQYATEAVQVTSAENRVRTSYLSLTQLLDLPADADFTVLAVTIEDSLEMTEYGIDSIYSAALSLPQIKSAELSLEKSKIDHKIQKGLAYPSLRLSAGYGTYFSDGVDGAFFSQFNDNRNPSLSISLSIPIFNGWSSNTSIRNSRLNVKNYELELKKSKQNLYKEVQQAYNEAVNAYATYRASFMNKAAAEESFRNMENKFNVDMLNGTDYIVAKSNMFKAQSEFYQSKFQYIFQLKILDYYRGIPITL